MSCIITLATFPTLSNSIVTTLTLKRTVQRIHVKRVALPDKRCSMIRLRMATAGCGNVEWQATEESRAGCGVKQVGNVET